MPAPASGPAVPWGWDWTSYFTSPDVPRFSSTFCVAAVQVF